MKRPSRASFGPWGRVHQHDRPRRQLGDTDSATTRAAVDFLTTMAARMALQGARGQRHPFRIAGCSHYEVAARSQQDWLEADLVQLSGHRLDDLYCLLEPGMEPPRLLRRQ